MKREQEAEVQRAKAQWEQEQREREAVLTKEWEAKLAAEKKRIQELLEGAIAQIGDEAAKKLVADITSQV